MRRFFTFLAALVALGAGAADVTFGTLSTRREGYWQAEAKYPLLDPAEPLAKLANAQLKRWVTSRHREFIAQIRTDLHQLGGKPDTEWDQSIEPTVAYLTATLYCVRFGLSSYTGGAHPNHEDFTFTYALIDGKPRRLALKDLFTRPSEAAKLVNDLLVAKLKKDEKAAWIADGTVKSIEPVQLERFIVGPDGLTFLLNPYEVGPYAVGGFEIPLSFDELGPTFKRTMLMNR